MKEDLWKSLKAFSSKISDTPLLKQTTFTFATAEGTTKVKLLSPMFSLGRELYQSLIRTCLLNIISCISSVSIVIIGRYDLLKSALNGIGEWLTSPILFHLPF